jgi:hypothetical protein
MCPIYTYDIYTRAIYYLDHPSNRANQTNWSNPVCPRSRTSVKARARAFNRVDQLHALWSSWWGPDRADRPRERRSPCDLVIFRCRSVILLYRQPFCCNELSHFTSLISTIFLQWTHPFCQSELSHFVRHSRNFCLVILLQWTLPFLLHCESFYDFATVVSIILLILFLILSTIFAILLSHFVTLL